MPRLFRILMLCVPAFVVSSCTQKSAPASAAPHATITLRDGTTYAGTVTASSPAQLTVVGDDKQSRTFDMPNVKSVEYGDSAMPQPEQAHENHYHPPESAIQTKTYTVPAGTQVSVRNEETIDSSRAVEGQTFAAEVTRDVVDADGAVVIPHGSNAQIVIRSASGGGRFHGKSDLAMDLESVSIDGRRYRLETVDVVKRGKDGVGGNKRTAKFAGSGAAIGAVIGALAGHGKGAAIGAASGAGAGVAGELLTKGQAVRVPAESVITFRLEAPLRVTP